MKLKIVCGFPGIGKSEFFRNNPLVHDSDSSKFPKDNFPSNYIKYLSDDTDSFGKPTLHLASSHKSVREALVENGLDFVLVYPTK